MVYMAADTGESFYQAALEDIREMKRATFGAEIKVFVHADAPSPWLAKCWTITGTNGKEGEATPLECSKQKGCDHHESVLKFVEMCQEHPDFGAEHYLLILWGHGEGIDWKEKVLADAAPATISGAGKRFGINSQSAKEIGELGKVLNALQLQVEGKVVRNDDVVIGFDACLMGMVEVYYEIKEKIGWAVAANDEIPDTGWPYQEILNRLGEKPEIAPGDLVENIVNECKLWYSDKGHESKVSFSACHLNAPQPKSDEGPSDKEPSYEEPPDEEPSDEKPKLLEVLRDRVRVLVQVLLKNIDNDSVLKAIQEARDFAEDYREHAYIDLHAFCRELRRQLDPLDRTEGAGNSENRLLADDQEIPALKDDLKADVVQNLAKAAQDVQRALNSFVRRRGFSDEYPARYMKNSRALSICFPRSPDLTGSLPNIEVNWGNYTDLTFSDESKWPNLLVGFWKTLGPLIRRSNT